MGLDAVEITRPLEEAFDIRIENEEIAQISTPRDLIDLIMSKVAQADVAGSLTLRAFNRLRAALLVQLPLNRRDIAPRTRLADLAPKTQRRILLDCLAADLGTPPMPPLVRPQWLVNVLAVCCIALGLAIAVFLYRHGPWQHRSALFLTALVIAVGLGYLANAVTRTLRSEFPSQVATVGDLARWIVGNKPDLAGATPGKWTREQVAAKVREVVIEQLDCGQNSREDASFIQDLDIDSW